MKLSVIMPAYNEAKTIGESVAAMRDSLEKAGFDFEIIVVSDGSRDATFKRAISLKSDRIKVYEYFPNQGKGVAVRYGFYETSGDIIATFDAGMDYPAEQLNTFLEILEKKGVDVVIGSKRHPDSKVDYPFSRRVVSFLAQTCVKLLFNLSVKDTQAGSKVFRREVWEKIAPLLLVKRYASDMEVLVLAQHFGYRITEAPVNLSLKFSTAFGRKHITRALWDALSVFYRLRILRFYDKPKKEREAMLANYGNTFWGKFFQRTKRLWSYLTASHEDDLP